MSYPLRPSLTWGYSLESSLTLTYPQRPWKYADGGWGGHAVAASGIPESFAGREDDILRLELRVTEGELPAFRQFLRWARSSGEPFGILLDADVPATEFSVYLVAPVWTSDRVEYDRDEEYPELFVVPIEIRREDGGTFDVSWWDLATETEA